MGRDFVIDTSVVLSWCFQDETNPLADFILDSLVKDTAFVPAIWPLEIGNVLLVAERRQRLNEAGTARFLSLLSDLPIVVEQEPPERMFKEILALAREHRLSSYDASYLDLALRKGLALATLDGDLATAARRSRVSLVKAG